MGKGGGGRFGKTGKPLFRSIKLPKAKKKKNLNTTKNACALQV